MIALQYYPFCDLNILSLMIDSQL